MVKFKIGDQIRCISVGKLGGESEDWVTVSGCKVGKLYTVYTCEKGENTPQWITVKEDPILYGLDSRHFVKVTKKKITKRTKWSK